MRIEPGQKGSFSIMMSATGRFALWAYMNLWSDPGDEIFAGAIRKRQYEAVNSHRVKRRK